MPNPILTKRLVSGYNPAPAWSTLNNGVVAAWNFSDATDALGNYDLTNNNSVTFPSGNVGNAATFAKASSQYFTRVDAVDLRHGNRDWCWMIDINATSQVDSQAIIQKENGTTALEFIMTLSAGVTRYVTASIRDGSTTNVATVTSAVAISNATWYSVVVWFDASVGSFGTIYISVNDETPVSTAASAAPGTTTEPTYVGALQVGGLGYYWDGQFDRMVRYNRIPTAAEITEFAGGGKEYPY